MSASLDRVHTLDDLRAYIHTRLCEKENLLADQFSLAETQLHRRSRACGMQFSLQGPRNVRLGAIWTTDHNTIYLYDAQGNRYEKVRLKHRLHESSLGGSQDSHRDAA